MIPRDFDVKHDRAWELLAYIINRHLLDNMRRISLELDLDFETAFIWGVMCQINMTPHLKRVVAAKLEAPPEVLTEKGRMPAGSLTPVSIAELCRNTGLPKETIRRKINSLAKQGKALKMEQGWIIDPACVDPGLREYTRESAKRLIQTAFEIREVLSRVEVPHTAWPVG